MNSCEAARPAPLRCPTLPEIVAAILALLPKGRAWQSNEGGPIQEIDAGFTGSAFADGAFQTRRRRGSTLRNFWNAIAGVLLFVNQRLCDLRLEFWCATHRETDDLWMLEYGLPDDCDPFPDLCTKVAALGGTRCEYYYEIAARAGWSIECDEITTNCGAQAGCGYAGKARPGLGVQSATLRIIVHLNESPSYTGGRYLPSMAGRMLAGRPISCGPSIDGLRCLIARIVHAEILTVYEAI